MINENITTARLVLIPTSAALLKLEMNSIEKLAEKLSVSIPANWPPEFMHYANPIFLFHLESYPGHYPWCTWYWLLKNDSDQPALMIGCGGFMGPPVDNGTVEIGYSILPQFQGKGFATEGTSALIKWAFSNEKVNLIAAETYPGLSKSIRILDKLGFTFTGKGVKPDTIRYELTRENYKES